VGSASKPQKRGSAEWSKAGSQAGSGLAPEVDRQR